ncbi:rRNA maturation RNase YbeY [methanotrophic endosymbiont of Bathymodiolus puteoserpentis (Logatchev)]|jgi:probable rRNA maturation factor|uniref:rRNA maturation RNase YbeY n=1 Tax=methanotrophic endosymbiont of Bathymodiolus puteoserpentis (Logatchev) TaxID=343235 RepID=UPI0013C89F05|nr:rRNA maturation RNase YbeY [methanotrophic endosymbiont of Bathymodiolus puteoserpentis (Logatchev)]SHE19882.1 Metal-dependent hydrolase YbeY, involved in rRNA and/or ribosome maturation and assembly [methanotrophic endosymbiont of Bathymodiolus puteoserpentis (Logatchev)]
MLARWLDIQRIVDLDSLPSDDDFQLWVETALADYNQDAEILIRIIDTQEMIELNSRYRGKLGATNILSFPFELPDGVEAIDLLGDLVVCAAVLEQEAEQQNKTLSAHWAHIIIHGVLHLLGYDHLTNDEAIEMESKEIILLQELHIDNPYQEKEVNG